MINCSIEVSMAFGEGRLWGGSSPSITSPQSPMREGVVTIAGQRTEERVVRDQCRSRQIWTYRQQTERDGPDELEDRDSPRSHDAGPL